MSKMSDRPIGSASDVLSRAPVRFGCKKKWNKLSRKQRYFSPKKSWRFTKSDATEFKMVMEMDFKLYLMSVNLHNDADPSITHQGKLETPTEDDELEISSVWHCDGLLLCILQDETSFVLWNPYCLQTRWFKPITFDSEKFIFYTYALGYEQNSRSYKILRFYASSRHHIRYEIYYVKSSSSTATIPITIHSDWEILSYASGVSVKGNTYWFAQEKIPQNHPDYAELDPADFLICFDFTNERFGPRLRLPFHSYIDDTVTLSSVRDEQLAVLFQSQEHPLHMEIWITAKIQPDAVSWNTKVFLALDMYPLIYEQFPVEAGSFFVDEEKRVVVVFDKGNSIETRIRNVAYIIGDDGYLKKVDFGKSPPTYQYIYPLYISYVPSSAQIIKPPAPRAAKRKNPKGLS